MKNLVATFYNDTHTRNAVREYILAVFNDKALKAVYQGENTEAYKPARDVINAAFSQMEAEFSPKEPKKNLNRSR
ncbi:MAG: hypothetical protein ACPGYY_10315 [Bacteroidia bacterium]